jgi:threonylcarbamoyladenosine tRNA methylthiotransferase MtaB
MASRPPEQVLDEVRRLVDHGYRELVFTGIHLGHYGVDFNRGRPKSGWVRLAGLLRLVAVLPGDFRVRLSSIEATEVTHELLAVMAEHPERICPHLHVSMQSGSDRVLARMRRRWGVRRFLDRCALARRALDRPALTTDVIVGFPGETDQDFEDTCRAVAEAGFAKLHVFPFSPRPGTPAAGMPDQVSPAVKTERMARLQELERRLQGEYFASLLGRRLRVLVESPLADRPGRWIGTSCRFAPVELAAAATQRRQFADVVATRVEPGRIVAADG